LQRHAYWPPLRRIKLPLGGRYNGVPMTISTEEFIEMDLWTGYLSQSSGRKFLRSLPLEIAVCGSFRGATARYWDCGVQRRKRAESSR
jgi:hypothetical protein